MAGQASHAAAVTKSAGIEQLQDSKGANEIDNGIENRDIDEFRTSQHIAVQGNPENDGCTDGINGQQPVKRRRSAHRTDKRQHKRHRTGSQSRRKHHAIPPDEDAGSSDVTRRSISPLSTSSAKDGSTAFTRNCVPPYPVSTSIVVVPGVSVIELA